jgi:hypothetical protein
LRRGAEISLAPQAIFRAIPKLTPMKPAALTPEIRMAIHLRGELLFDLVTEAEGSGASSEVIDQFLTEEIEDMQAQLRAIYPPERVRAIVDELLVLYDAYRRWAYPE